MELLSAGQFNATFVAVTGTSTDVRYNTGVRIRGSASREAAVPNNRSISFSKRAASPIHRALP